MKVETLENKYIIYLNKYYLNSESILNRSILEKHLKKIFLHLQKYYNLDIFGFFYIDCFIYDKYGTILEIEQYDSDFSFYSKKTDMKITFYDNIPFLYRIDNYFIKNIFDEGSIKLYLKDDQYYVELNNINDKDTAYIMENSNKIIYGDEALDIIKNNSFIPK